VLLAERAKHFGVVFVDLLRRAWIEYQRDRANYLAVAMIYYAVVSLVPLLSLLLSTLGLLLRFSPVVADAERKILIGLEAHLGTPILEPIKLVLETLQQKSIIGALISMIGLFWGASVLFKHLRLTFRAIWNYEPPLIAGSALVVARTIILEKIISLVLALGAAGLFLVALALTAAIQWTERLLGLFNLSVGRPLAALGSFVLYSITFALLFKFLPPVSIRWREIWPAAMLCAFVWVAASELLAIYGALFGGARSAYGAIGGILAALLWINIGSQALFFGAELCKVTVKRAEDAK
jgi:membrane protein